MCVGFVYISSSLSTMMLAYFLTSESYAIPIFFNIRITKKKQTNKNIFWHNCITIWQ
jgi:hypothetical protein